MKTVNNLSRVLALDIGTKRTGVAVTDELKIIASGLTTIDTKSLFKWLQNYLSNEKVEIFVVGEPKQLNNLASESANFINEIVKKLQQTFPKISMVRVDERFTSKIAFQSMIDGGLKKKQRQNKALIDEVSATLILQSYLEQHGK